jgi:fido (protein-threonine AMPylation protein)
MTKQKAPDDLGAFGILTPTEAATINGAAFYVAAKLAQRPRTSSDWSHPLLLGIHRDLFKDVFLEHAGKLRLKDVTFRSHRIPEPQQIPYRLDDVLSRARTIIDDNSHILDPTTRMTTILPRIASFHAECVVIQPFIDGNKRWARQVLNAIMTDSGFYPGTEFVEDQHVEYLDGIDKTIAEHPEQLTHLIANGWITLREKYQAGKY